MKRLRRGGGRVQGVRAASMLPPSQARELLLDEEGSERELGHSGSYCGSGPARQWGDGNLSEGCGARGHCIK